MMADELKYCIATRVWLGGTVLNPQALKSHAHYELQCQLMNHNIVQSEMPCNEFTVWVGGGTHRYNSLDVLKVLCAFFIVCIHAPFPGTWGGYFTSITRIAVPIFFMISGFFWKAESN